MSGQIKKVALVICYFQHNYGSQLQALATQMICDKLRIGNETIRIDGLKPEINKAKYRYFLSRIFDINTIKDKMSTVRKLIAKRTNTEYKKNLAKGTPYLRSLPMSVLICRACTTQKQVSLTKINFISSI